MSKSINQVLAMGNLTRAVEIRSTASGLSVASFSLALNRSYQDQNKEWQEATDYVDIVVWGKLAELVASRLNKGNRALVIGRIQSSSWDDKETGKKRNKTEVLATDVTFLDQIQNEVTNSTDVVLEDINAGPIDLSEIPF